MPKRRRTQDAKRAAQRAAREQYVASWKRIPVVGRRLQEEACWFLHDYGDE